ncbi:putative molybdenum carrier protein [Rhodocaloribacter sp.]
MYENERIRKVVSGGQTGVDRAALDAATAAGLPVGGWCPRGRRAADGVIDARYPLRETPSAAYAERTAWNVRDSDGTLVLLSGEPAGGTALTLREAKRQGKPLLVHRLGESGGVEKVRAWIAREGIRVLNVAGPREEEAPGIYADARTFLTELFAREKTGG